SDLHRAEADRRVALFHGRMQLAQGQHRLAVALRIERDSHAKARRIVVDVGPMLDLEQPRRFDAQEHHAVLIARAVWRDIHETPAAAGAGVDLKGFVLESLRREPPGDLLGIGPRLKHTYLRRVDHTQITISRSSAQVERGSIARGSFFWAMV